MIITFTKPILLSLLGIIPIFILIHFITIRRKRAQALQFANFEAIARVTGVDLVSKNIVVLALFCLAAASLVLSIAGTTYHTELQASEFSFILALDTSRSMEATDLFPNRLEAAKETAIAFVETLGPGTKVGVISFSGNALIETPLTEDRILTRQRIRQIPLSSIGGTDLYEAVITSSNLLENEDSKSIILLSDGQITVGTVDDAVAYANTNNVIVHTIGIGTPEGGNTTYGVSKLDENSLQGTAYSTQGQFYRVQTNSELQDAFTQIVNLRLKKVAVPLSPHLVIATLVLLIINFILVSTRYKIIP